MANWCMNTVVFQGEASQLDELEKMVQQMIKKEQRDGKGQLFPMVTADSGYLFQIEYDHGTLYYRTKYEPNTQVLTAVSDWLRLDYIHSYDEPAMHVYGQDSYIKGVLKEAFISLEDYGLFDFDRGQGCYRYRGACYDDVTEIYDLILAAKLKDNSP
jgi:hypothetical protein